MWSSPVNANSLASKAWKKERWVRGTVISQEGAMVNVHVDSSVIVNILHIENPHAARVTKLTHRTVFRYPADRNFNEKTQFRVYIYIYIYVFERFYS